MFITEKHRKAEQVARILMVKHGLTNYCFKWDSAIRRAGRCRYPAWGKCGIIGMSIHHVALNSETEIIDTILHEIAHALAPGDGHGKLWKQKCREIGAKPVACCDSTVVTPKGKYVAHCPSCNKEYRKHRLRNKEYRKWWCSGCGEENGELKFVWRG